MNASLNANAKLSLRGFTIRLYQAEINMGTKRNKACGADIHKTFRDQNQGVLGLANELTSGSLFLAMQPEVARVGHRGLAP